MYIYFIICLKTGAFIYCVGVVSQKAKPEATNRKWGKKYEMFAWLLFVSLDTWA